MRAPSWLTARPVAHRGLHDGARGIIENMPAAINAAIDGNFAIEVDLQLTADGEAMVHHDDALGRLTDGSGALLGLTARALQQISFKATAERMMTLGDLCDLVAGRVPLLLEIKTHFDDDRKLVSRIVEVLTSYRGPVAAMSFDPHHIQMVRELMPSLTRGIVAKSTNEASDWPKASAAQRRDMQYLRHATRTRPHFVAYRVNDLPAAAPWVAHNLFGCALLTWTVRTPEQRARAATHADQMIFEGFRPQT